MKADKTISLRQRQFAAKSDVLSTDELILWVLFPVSQTIKSRAIYKKKLNDLMSISLQKIYKL